VRSALVTALVARAENSLRAQLRRFLRGLSCDELEFIATFLGACILESANMSHGPGCTCQVADQPASRGAGRHEEDRELKMILLMEYLGRCGTPPNAPLPMNSGASLQ